MSENILSVSLALLVGSYLLLNASTKKREGFANPLPVLPPSFPTGGPSSADLVQLPQQGIMANPGNFPSIPSYRSDVMGLQQGGISGTAAGNLSAVGPQFVNSSSPIDFISLGSNTQTPLYKNNLLSSGQVDQVLREKFRQTPELQSVKDLMPVPDMKHSASIDPTNPENFIYDRTLFSRLKRRYGNGVDFIRGDIDITPERRGWFDIRPPSDVDVVQGYFDKYIDIEQETQLQDSVFSRSTPIDTIMEGNANPWGRVDKLPGVSRR